MDHDFDNICRICLDDECTDMHHIFNEGLNNKIIILSGIDIQLTDTLPKQICKECRYQLEKSYYFRMVAKQNDTRLRKHIRLINNNKHSSLLDKDYRDDDTEEYEETFLESYKYFETAQDQINALRLEFESEKERIIQEELEKRANTTTDLEKRPLRQSKRISSPPKLSPEKPKLLNKLPASNQRFETPPTIRRKQEKDDLLNGILLGNFEIQFLSSSGEVDETQQVLQVGSIEDSTGIEINYETHVPEEIEQLSAVVESDEDYKPEFKKKSPPVKQSKNKRKRVSVVKSIKSEKKSNEVVIEYTEDLYFIAIEDVDDQDLDENGEKKIFQCAYEQCSERFARRQACKTHYYNHLASQAVPNGFKCKFCQKTFKVSSALERHERVHTGDKPFKCDVSGCSKAFSQREMLKRHKIIHLAIEDAPFACTKCDKKFRQKEPLRLHINKAHSTNSESQAYTCSICSKNFAHSSGLSRHFLIHSGRLFSCEICGKAFNDKSAMKRHGQVHYRESLTT